MMRSALVETDSGLAVLGALRENGPRSLREITLDDPPEYLLDILELIFVIVREKSGCIIGMLPITTATNA